MKFYAGIGSRETPPRILTFMTRLAARLEILGWTLRSGGAPGADSAFEAGASAEKEIFLPWKGFNGNRSLLYGASQEAHDLAEEFHPAWERCSSAAMSMHARNVYQVLGRQLDANPELWSKFVLCWTRGGSGAGGTGQAIRIARAHDIPVFDLGSPSGWPSFKAYMASSTA